MYVLRSKVAFLEFIIKILVRNFPERNWHFLQKKTTHSYITKEYRIEIPPKIADYVHQIWIHSLQLSTIHPTEEFANLSFTLDLVQTFKFVSLNLSSFCQPLFSISIMKMFILHKRRMPSVIIVNYQMNFYQNCHWYRNHSSTYRQKSAWNFVICNKVKTFSSPMVPHEHNVFNYLIIVKHNCCSSVDFLIHSDSLIHLFRKTPLCNQKHLHAAIHSHGTHVAAIRIIKL